METAMAAPRSRRADGAPFWEGAARGELRVQACAVVRAAALAAAAVCPHCQSIDVRVGTRRRARPDLVVRRPPPAAAPAFAAVAPYNAIIVELEEDPPIRFAGNLVTERRRRDQRDRPRDDHDRRTGARRVPQIEDVFLPRWVRA